MSIDPKALEAARRIHFSSGLADDKDARTVARALLAGEGPDNGRGSMAAGGKSHVNGTEPCKSTPGARVLSPAVPKVDKLWIGVNSLGVPDLATLHVDERDCRELIDQFAREEGDALLIPRACHLVIGDASPSSSPSPAVRDALKEPEVMRMWRRCGLPEYFLGNDGSNHRLTAFARMCASAAEPDAPKEGK